MNTATQAARSIESLPPELVAKVLGYCAAARPTPFSGTADWFAGELAGKGVATPTLVPLAAQLEPLRP
jgi:hypothetical protein